jgi:hypothetical protein
MWFLETNSLHYESFFLSLYGLFYVFSVAGGTSVELGAKSSYAVPQF